MADAAVRVEALSKAFGSVRALEGVSLEVGRGQVLALLGPNGAGKTTLVRILTTLLRPDAGCAAVGGCDVVKERARVRALIGLTGQSTALDETLSGRENLILFGRLHHLGRREAGRRAAALLERLALGHVADRPVRTYSGGMRRRVDIAASLVGRPAVLFLDEPTTGLDPRSRLAVWDVVGELLAEGTTVLLTTQYLDEADRLADGVAVLDRGRVVAEGTPAGLKEQSGGEALELRPVHRGDTAGILAAVEGIACGRPRVDGDEGVVTVPVRRGTAALAATIRRLDAAGLELADLRLRQATLDDVFLRLTGGRSGAETRQPGPALRPAPAADAPHSGAA